MPYEDLVWRLSLFKKWSDYPIYLMETAYWEMNPGSRVGQQLTVLAVGKKGIITVFVRHGAFSAAFVASVTDIGGTGEPAAVLLVKVLTMLVAAWTGFTLDVAEFNLSTNIGVVTIKPPGTEVMGIEKEPLAGMVFG